MKILCLHGNGSNSNMMKLQTAALRHELEDEHEYEFVEAAQQAPMSDGLEMVSSPGDSFYAFYNPEDLSSLEVSISQLDTFLFTEGPFDAVIGFSGGAVLTAMYLIDHQRKQTRADPETKPPFKCAIFLSTASCRKEAGALGANLDGNGDILIRIPTAHIWGSKDTVAPTGGKDLASICDPAQREILVHDAGHEVPRQGYLVAAVHVIRRVLDLAERGSGAEDGHGGL